MSSRFFGALVGYLGCMALSCSGAESTDSAIAYLSDAEPVRAVADAQPGVFIPPYRDCVEPLDGEPGNGPDGKVCVNVGISGATEEGRYFPDYADCNVVITQRPYGPAAPFAPSAADDPRLEDVAFMAELEWAKHQIEATGCACCHDSRVRPSSQWDIASGPIWLDSLSNNGAALFAGLADSSVLGAYPPEDNFGFDRIRAGVPSTDPERMKALILGELERRGVSNDEAESVPPFGGPIYEIFNSKPTKCEAGVGIDASGVVHFSGDARYVFVLEDGTQNPGVPPNLDLPEGTLWRIDVLADSSPIQDGFRYGTTPSGVYQHTPPDRPAPALEFGTKYHFVVVKQVGLLAVNCTFQLER